MKTVTSHLTHSFVFLGIILLLGLINRSFLTLALFSAAIVLGALIIAWAAEASEIVMSQGLALAIVALLQVFPEFMIETTIAWAQDIPNMLSNFTGANRILTGIGWPLVFFTAAWFYYRKKRKFLKEITLNKEHSAEVLFFLAATLYSFVILFRGSLTILDSVVMVGIYVAYLLFVSRLPHPSRKKSEKHLMGIPKKIISLKKAHIMPAILLMFLVGGIMIFVTVEPFYQRALVIAASLGISEFLFIQWIAPILSEFPEKSSAFYWASKITQAPLALMNLISSKLTQWTLLMAIIPIVFSISAGAISPIPLGTTIAGTGITTSVELLLTIATSLYASTFLLKMRFTWFEAASLFLLWIVQFFWVAARPALIWVYFLLAAFELIWYRAEIKNAFIGFGHIFHHHVRK